MDGWMDKPWNRREAQTTLRDCTSIMDARYMQAE